MTEAERAAALALAKQPNVLDRVLADLGILGWIGEESAKRLTFLAAISRNLDTPVWVGLTASGPGEQCAGLGVIAAITPPEDRIHVSRLTDHAFTYADPAALRHKLLIIDDGSTISTGVGTTLRVLKQRGALSAPRIERDPVTGGVRTTFIELHGPVAVLTATGDTIDPQLQPHVVEVAADESPEQVARMFAERHRRLAQPVDPSEAERVTARLRNLQRVISSRSVTIPFAERIDGMGVSARARRDHDLLLALVASHALLHQHQRQVLDGSVMATVDDFTVASALVNERRVADQTGLRPQTQRLLMTMWSAGKTALTMVDLSRLLPDWTRYAFRTALAELVALDHCSCSRTGQGTVRTYFIHAPAGSTAGNGAAQPVISRIVLRELGDLAELGGTGFAKFIPDSNTG